MKDSSVKTAESENPRPKWYGGGFRLPFTKFEAVNCELHSTPTDQFPTEKRNLMKGWNRIFA